MKNISVVGYLEKKVYKTSFPIWKSPVGRLMCDASLLFSAVAFDWVEVVVLVHVKGYIQGNVFIFSGKALRVHKQSTPQIVSKLFSVTC